MKGDEELHWEICIITAAKQRRWPRMKKAGCIKGQLVRRTSCSDTNDVVWAHGSVDSYPQVMLLPKYIFSMTSFHQERRRGSARKHEKILRSNSTKKHFRNKSVVMNPNHMYGTKLLKKSSEIEITIFPPKTVTSFNSNYCCESCAVFKGMKNNPA